MARLERNSDGWLSPTFWIVRVGRLIIRSDDDSDWRDLSSHHGLCSLALVAFHPLVRRVIHGGKLAIDLAEIEFRVPNNIRKRVIDDERPMPAELLEGRHLLSGDHGAVARWRAEQSSETTRRRRPDLLEARGARERENQS